MTWRCLRCGGTVCRGCTLTDPETLHREYYEETLCSPECREDMLREALARKAVVEVMES